MTSLLPELFLLEQARGALGYRSLSGWPEGRQRLIAYLDRLESKQADELMDPFSAQYALEEEACFRHGFRLAGRLLGESFSAGS